MVVSAAIVTTVKNPVSVRDGKSIDVKAARLLIAIPAPLVGLVPCNNGRLKVLNPADPLAKMFMPFWAYLSFGKLMVVRAVVPLNRKESSPETNTSSGKVKFANDVPNEKKGLPTVENKLPETTFNFGNESVVKLFPNALGPCTWEAISKSGKDRLTRFVPPEIVSPP